MTATLLDRPPLSAEAQKSWTYCSGCGGMSSENRKVCDRCSGESLECVSHIGEIYSYTRVHQEEHDFVLALVRLSGGRMVTARIVDAEDCLKIGLPVELAPSESTGAGPGGLYFSPLGEFRRPLM